MIRFSLHLCVDFFKGTMYNIIHTVYQHKDNPTTQQMHCKIKKFVNFKKLPHLCTSRLLSYGLNNSVYSAVVFCFCLLIVAKFSYFCKGPSWRLHWSCYRSCIMYWPCCNRWQNDCPANICSNW